MQHIKICTNSCRKWLSYPSMHMHSNTKALRGQHNSLVIFMENTGGRGKSFSWTLTDQEGDKNQSDLESCTGVLQLLSILFPCLRCWILPLTLSVMLTSNICKKWNCTGDTLCLGLQEQKQLVSTFHIQASKNLVLIFFSSALLL